MSLHPVLRTSIRPAAALAGAITLAGCGIWLVKSTIFYSLSAESPNTPKAFSGFMGPSLRLTTSQDVNHNTKRLRFEFPNPDAQSGLNLTSSVLTVSWPKGRWFPVLRPYTPVSPLDARGYIDLLVKRYPSGKASTYLHSLVPGESLFFITGLRGYRWTPNKYSHITLIAGGAGITPMYQLIQGILGNPEDKTAITLVFGVNSDEDALFKKEFDEFEQRFPGKFKAVYTVSQPVKGSSFRKGYVTKDLLEEVAPGPEKDAMVFICGPPAMESALLGGPRSKGAECGILEQLGYGKDQVRKF